jgi:CubicO group peptidase (beta-lactamase class C family)
VLVLVTVGLTVLWTPIGSQSPEAQANAYFANILKLGMPGVAGAVAVNGKIVFSSAAGIADRSTGARVTPATVFNIASVSKVLTATALMQLIERGQVGMDDPIQKYVPAFPDKGSPITIKHLVTHTSGIRHYLDETTRSKTRYTFEQSLALFEDDPLLFTPGRFYFYSSYGVNLLQGVIEKASGLRFEDYMRRNVWQRAGMTNTRLDIPERRIPNRARAYLVSAGGREAGANDLSYAYAAGGMLSTAEDLVRFGVALNHGRLISRASLARMYETLLDPVMRYEASGVPSRMDFQQGFIWRVRFDQNGRRYLHHPGSVNGFNAHLVIFPDDDVVASVLYNADDLPPLPPGQPRLVPDDQLGVVVLATPYLPMRTTRPDR